MRTFVVLSLNFLTKYDKKTDKYDKLNTIYRVIYMAINYGKIKYLRTCASIKDLPVMISRRSFLPEDQMSESPLL